ncbi:hypothetical protein Tco_0697650 [Tanacetum coccineum]
MVDRLKLERRDLMGGFPLTKLDLEEEYQAKLPKSSFEAIKRVFRYLKETLTWVFGIEDNALSLTAYARSDHAGCQDSRRRYQGGLPEKDPTSSKHSLPQQLFLGVDSCQVDEQWFRYN